MQKRELQQEEQAAEKRAQQMMPGPETSNPGRKRLLQRRQRRLRAEKLMPSGMKRNCKRGAGSSDTGPTYFAKLAEQAERYDEMAEHRESRAHMRMPISGIYEIRM